MTECNCVCPVGVHNEIILDICHRITDVLSSIVYSKSYTAMILVMVDVFWNGTCAVSWLQHPRLARDSLLE